MEPPPPSYHEAIGFNHLSNNVAFNHQVQQVKIQPNLSNLQTRVKSKRNIFSQYLNLQSFNQVQKVHRQDIKDYGKTLGVNLRKYPNLLKYVIASILEGVPPNWVEGYNKNGVIYYQNNLLNETQWEHPLDDFYRTKIQQIIKEKSCW